MFTRQDMSDQTSAGLPSRPGTVRERHQARIRRWRRLGRRVRLSFGPLQRVAVPNTAIGTHRSDLHVRLATSRRDVRNAQRLRFQVFYREMSASASPTARLKRRDVDSYDAICDHLLVVDRKPAPRPTLWSSHARVVGTYRMLMQDVAERHTGFYSQAEFDLRPLIASRGPDCKFLELGRSCVLQPYRTTRTVELLWQGLWAYIKNNGVSVMIGCASFEGINPEAHARALSYLHHGAAAPGEWSVRAHADRRVGMNMLPASALNPRRVMRELPPLIKAYLRLGCFVGDGAVVDEQFGTTDVLMILPVARIDPRYIAHFGAPGDSRREG